MVSGQAGLVKGRFDVRFGSQADMCTAIADVRFTPKSDRKSRHTANGHVCFTPESGRQDSPAVSSHRNKDITHHAIDFPSSAANNFASCP
jgi:hypothetical protein